MGDQRTFEVRWSESRADGEKEGPSYDGPSFIHTFGLSGKSRLRIGVVSRHGTRCDQLR